jgi:hypothetical protein
MYHRVIMSMGRETLAEHEAATLPEALRTAAEWVGIVERDSGRKMRPSSFMPSGLSLSLITERDDRPGAGNRVHIVVCKPVAAEPRRYATGRV